MTARPFLTAAYVALHARRRSEARALVRGDRTVTFAAMAGHLRSVTSVLAELGLPRGGLAALGLEDGYLELLLVLGFEALGVVVEMIRPDAQGMEEALTDGPDLLVSPIPLPPGPSCRVLVADEAWWRMVLAAPTPPGEAPASRGAAAEPVLVLHSSGTTGRPKRMLATRGMLDVRIRQRARSIRLTRTSRCLAILPLGVAGQYYNAVACLRLGATLVLRDDAAIALTLAARRVTHATLLPFQLEQVLGALPAEWARLPALTLCVIGGPLPSPVRRLALDRLCGGVVSMYSSNEAGSIGVVQPGAVQPGGDAALVPGLEVQVVDENGRALPPGAVGQVRVRGAGVVEAYLGRRLEAGPPFPGGWFLSEDLGALSGSLSGVGRLRLLGRYDDLLNLGGIKVPCAEVEARIQQALPLRDVAVFMRDDDAAGQTLVVCAVPLAVLDAGTARDGLRPVLNGRFELHLMACIPRTPLGKVRRRALRDALASPGTERQGMTGGSRL